MAAGVWLHMTEHHEHDYFHAPMAHTHPHVHNEHHRHAHSAVDPGGEPHTHFHEHKPMRHAAHMSRTCIILMIMARSALDKTASART